MIPINSNFSNVIEVSTPTQILSRYSGSPIYLGGSRRMFERYQVSKIVELSFDIRESTDYDYYTQHSNHIEDYLKLHGFALTKASEQIHSRNIDNMVTEEAQEVGYQFDDECVSIYQLNNTQIVLRRDAEFYKTVFESIPVEFWYQHMWKSAPHREDIPPLCLVNIKDAMNAFFTVARNSLHKDTTE